jgi:hypothetical protein
MRFFPIILVAALTACGSSDDVDMENASVADVARELREADSSEGFVNPGQWQQTVKLVEIDAPGMPPQIAEAMKQQTGTSQVNESCLTPEQAKRPREDFFTGAEKNCRYEHFKWGSGKVDLKLVCKEDQANRIMELTGDYEPNAYRMAMTARTEGGPPEQALTMKMQVDAKRIGECPARKG